MNTAGALPAFAQHPVKSGTMSIEQIQVVFQGLAVSLGADAMVIEFK